MKTERKKRDKKHLKGRILRSISLILICSMILSTLIGYLYFNQVVRKQRLEEEKNRLMQVGNQIAFQAEVTAGLHRVFWWMNSCSTFWKRTSKGMNSAGRTSMIR